MQHAKIWPQVQAQLAQCLVPKGLTIFHAFTVQLFNSQGCPAEHQLPTFGRHLTAACIVGNTNLLWPHFLQHLAHNPQLLQLDDPLDQYVEATVIQAVQQCCQQLPVPHATGIATPIGHECTMTQQGAHLSAGQGMSHPQHPTTTAAPSSSTLESPPPSSSSSLRFEIRFSHHTEPGKFVNMMRAAQLSGLAYYSSTTHLCMHPVFGPWFALRAVVVFDLEGPEPSCFTQLPCPYPQVEAEAAQEMQRLEALGGFENWQQHWQDWAALRALGGRHTDPRYAYSPDQLEYHCTKRKEVLQRAVAALEQQQQQQQQQEL